MWIARAWQKIPDPTGWILWAKHKGFSITTTIYKRHYWYRCGLQMIPCASHGRDRPLPMPGEEVSSSAGGLSPGSVRNSVGVAACADPLCSRSLAMLLQLQPNMRPTPWNPPHSPTVTLGTGPRPPCSLHVAPAPAHFCRGLCVAGFPSQRC